MPETQREVRRVHTLVPPNASRRRALKFMGALLYGAGLLRFSTARAAGNAELAFASGSLEDVLQALGAAPVADARVSLSVPDFVENGAVVPVEVWSALSGPQTIHIISEANPFPLVASFVVPEGTDPFVSTRIKVARSCNVHALVEVDGRCYSAVKATQVTVGGCGA